MTLVPRPQRRTIRRHVPRPRGQIPAGDTYAPRRTTTQTAHPQWCDDFLLRQGRDLLEVELERKHANILGDPVGRRTVDQAPRK